jgi:UDP-N-acetylglucosamine 2-epimerase
MSQIFFDDLRIPKPEKNLGIGSDIHGRQTGLMLIGIEEVLLSEMPDLVLVYGDTNSTLAGALAAVKLNIPVAHVEAGLRSFNREMPEEHNRILTDHCSNLLFCPTKTAVKHLQDEGISRGVFQVGDVMYDAVLQFSEIAQEKSRIFTDLNLDNEEYILATVHRPYNTDQPEKLKNILDAFQGLSNPIVFPVHPRTKKKIDLLESEKYMSNNIKVIDPVGYLDMLLLEKNAKMILTDSGGIQKEAFFFQVPCVTLRNETEWVETVEAGWNILVGSDKEKILSAVENFEIPTGPRSLIFGNGDAAEKISNQLNG